MYPVPPATKTPELSPTPKSLPPGWRVPNKVLDILANNQLRLDVDAVDERLLIDGLHKIANRIALGLILAALIVGAALLMQVPTTFRILGYPGLAILFFLAAACGGVALVVSILTSDRTPPERKKRSR